MPGGLRPGRVTGELGPAPAPGAATVGWRPGAGHWLELGALSLWSLSQPPAPAHGGHQEDKRTLWEDTSSLSRSGSRHGHAVTVQHTDTCECWGAVLIPSLH